MKVLLTGGTGFLGSHVLRALRQADVETIATHAQDSAPDCSGIEWVKVDLLDPAASRALIDRTRPTHLLHMAWRPVFGNVASASDNIDWLKASLDLASAFLDAGGRRIVGSGSCFEYDWSNGVCTEDETPLVPSTLYGAGKNALRAALFGMAREAGASFAWPRVFFTYGPGENDTRFVTSLISAMLRGAPAEMTSGVQVRDFVYAEDVAQAMLALLQSEHEGDFNIATGAAVPLIDIATEVALQIGRPDLLHVGARTAKGYEPALIQGATDKTARTLNWRATTSLQDGVARTIAAKRNGM